MSKCRKGYTLIEVIIVLAIVLLLGGVTTTLSYETLGDYFINLDRCYNDDRFDNALLYIDTLCNSNGIISIEENEEVSVKIIYLRDNNLKVRTLNYKEDTVSVGDNTLLDKVISFKVRTKKNLVYYYIENKESKVRGRCI